MMDAFLEQTIRLEDAVEQLMVDHEFESISWHAFGVQHTVDC